MRGKNVSEITLVYPLGAPEPDASLKAFDALAGAGVNLEIYDSTPTTVWMVVEKKSKKKAALALGKAFKLLC